MPDAAVKTHVLYLHGFASSPRSSKAAYLAERLTPHGIDLRCPDFNLPEFQTMTMTRMLGQLIREVEGLEPGPVALIGSSLGGSLAILATPRLAGRVERLVLLAPAVMFGRPNPHLLPPERLERWRLEGTMNFFHYGDQTDRQLDFTFYEDSLKYDVFGTAFSQPALIFQGRSDASVDYRTVEAFAASRPGVTLSLLDDEHQLTASLPRIWPDLESFLELAD